MREKSPFIDNYRTPRKLSELPIEEPENKKPARKKAVLYVRKKT
jgi:hypothetical protein